MCSTLIRCSSLSHTQTHKPVCENQIERGQQHEKSPLCLWTIETSNFFYNPWQAAEYGINSADTTNIQLSLVKGKVRSPCLMQLMQDTTLYVWFMQQAVDSSQLNTGPTLLGCTVCKVLSTRSSFVSNKRVKREVMCRQNSQWPHLLDLKRKVCVPE